MVARAIMIGGRIRSFFLRSTVYQVAEATTPLHFYRFQSQRKVSLQLPYSPFKSDPKGVAAFGSEEG